MPAQGSRTGTPQRSIDFQRTVSPAFSEKDISFINRSSFNIGLVQQPDKIVARCALTIYPYSLANTFNFIDNVSHIYRIRSLNLICRKRYFTFCMDFFSFGVAFVPMRYEIDRTSFIA